ncbi:hypothetical protein [Alicyclobacillus shizuokensis]|uniref:hypothetical protein n=1 Tax=Alicyclobacillus shizuokensis TaxID=392014 RepID=UPI0008306035|nr:hypothetical protein [Alicyclobacillus shizuokensis]
MAFVGHAVGGALVAWIHPVSAVLVDGGSFLLSALSLAVIPIPPLCSKGRAGVWGFIKDRPAGLHFIGQRPAVRTFGLYAVDHARLRGGRHPFAGKIYHNAFCRQYLTNSKVIK